MSRVICYFLKTSLHNPPRVPHSSRKVYIIGFSASLLLLYVAGKKEFKGQVGKICAFIAILIPCLIAALRSYNVGTDVEVYVRPLFYASNASETFSNYIAISYSLSGWDLNFVSNFEIGFTVLVFLVERIFGNFQILLFIIQALTVIPIYRGLRAFGKQQPVWMGMAVYYLMFYNQSLNMMRQWIAMALLFYALHYLRDRKYGRYFLIWALAILFHKTALIGLAVFVVYILIAKENTYNKTIKTLLIAVVGMVSLMGLPIVAQLLSNLGFNYGGYITGTLRFMPNQLLYRLPLMVLMIFQWRRMKKVDTHARFYLLMLVFDVLASQLTSLYSLAGRIGVYFSEYYMLAYPAVYVSSARKDNKKLIGVAIMAYLCIYWWYSYVYLGNSETVPYEFFFSV